MSAEVLGRKEILLLLEPSQFCRLNAFQRQQLISIIGPKPDRDLKRAMWKATAAFCRMQRPIPGFKLV